MKNPVKFGKYYLLERINVGGMAEVFKAKSFGEAGFERLVAVKRILPSIAEDQEFIAMFIDEAKLAVQLTHPNIAQIFELGKVGEAYFIALEYVPGKDLRSMYDRARKRGEPLPIPMACYMVMKICEGLDYAHNKKDAAGRNLELVHRDVSPQNMLMSWDGDVKLIDFGIAKAASKSSKTQAGILKGKFGYMSPEQVRGLQIDRRSDIFSVGIVLYELLTMERLFVGESDFSTLEKVRNVEIMPPSTYNRKIPEELEQIVLKALAKHPEDRYRTAMDLHDDLQSFMYTSGNFFARKDLGAFMHRVFQDELVKEAAKDEEFRKFDSRRASDLDVFDSVAAPPATSSSPAGRNAPPPPPPAAARVSVPPPPPPAARIAKPTVMGMGATLPNVGGGRASSATAMAVAPSVRASIPTAAPTAAVAPAAAQAAGIEMDWDDEELATQVYDRPEAYPGLPPRRSSIPPPVPPANGHAVAAGRTSSVPAPGPAAFAPPRSPTMPMPAASIPPPKALPAIPAPAAAVAAPFPSSMVQPAVGAPVHGAYAAVGAPTAQPQSYGFRGEPTAVNYAAPSEPQRRNTGLIVVLSLVGVLVVAAGVVMTLRAFRADPVGTLDISTNIPGATVLVDDQAQPGNGMHFSVPGLATASRHRVLVRRDGFLTFQQDVPVRPDEVTPMQIALLPDPALAPPIAPAPQQQVAAPVVPPPVAPIVVPPVQAVPPAPVAVAPTPVAPTPRVAAVAPSAPPHRTSPAHNNAVAAAPHAASQHVSAPTHAPSGPAAGGGGTGTLSISTRPASQCTVNGQTFSTPRLHLELPAGTQRVTCRNTDFNVSATFPVTIRAGQETREVGHPLN